MLTCASYLPNRMVRAYFTWAIFPIYFTQDEFAQMMEDPIKFFRSKGLCK